MLGKLKSLDRRLLTRRCVSCGYDGALLRGGQAKRCARCGCDLHQRPARSYAEMEGLLGHPTPLPSSEIHRLGLGARRDETLIHRWLAFSFLTMVFLVVLACVLAAAVPG
jgi:hypothetical protein